MKPRHWILLLLLGLFGACTYRFLGGLRAYEFHGQVVDAETGTPLSGAAVTVVWTRSGVGIESHASSLLNAQETVTDVNGRFSLKVSSGLDWNPLSTRDDDPRVVVYKPGYEPLWAATTIYQGFKTIEMLVAALTTGTTIKLRTLEAAKLTAPRYFEEGSVLPGASIPRERIPNLMRAINAQRKMAGLQPLPELTEKGTTP
jgi:hypothetical protein